MFRRKTIKKIKAIIKISSFNIFISCNSMPTFNDKCALLITYYLDNTTTKELCIHIVSSFGSGCIIRVSSTEFITKTSVFIYKTQYLLLAILAIQHTALQLQSDEYSNLSNLVNHICNLKYYVTVNKHHRVIVKNST